jgi:hypothetical protein
VSRTARRRGFRSEASSRWQEDGRVKRFASEQVRMNVAKWRRARASAWTGCWRSGPEF